jgi:hypothetical protein
MALHGTAKVIVDVIENSLNVIQKSVNKNTIIGRIGIARRKINDLQIREDAGKRKRGTPAKEYAERLLSIEKEKAGIIAGTIDVPIAKPKSYMPKDLIGIMDDFNWDRVEKR